VEVPEETADSFGGNALIKSVNLAAWLGEQRFGLEDNLMVLADDSGLEVEALAGAPGVQSARFAGLDDGRQGNTPDAENNAKLIRLMEAIPNATRAARFRCVLALTPCINPELLSAEDSLRGVLASQTHFFEGTCEGRLAMMPSGGGGFGYDPLFIPAGATVSMAELGSDEKNRISHRAKALAKLVEALQQQP
jgi:XTP/dITP diphosphohydrolase